jgi:hypothetical protein
MSGKKVFALVDVFITNQGFNSGFKRLPLRFRVGGLAGTDGVLRDQVPVESARIPGVRRDDHHQALLHARRGADPAECQGRHLALYFRTVIRSCATGDVVVGATILAQLPRFLLIFRKDVVPFLKHAPLIAGPTLTLL